MPPQLGQAHASGQQKGKRERAVPAHRVGREKEVRPEPEVPDDPAARRIIQASLAGTAIFAVTAIPARHRPRRPGRRGAW